METLSTEAIAPPATLHAVERLLQGAAALSGCQPEETQRLARTLLGMPLHPPSFTPLTNVNARGRSELNWNGSPLQLLCSLRSAGWGVRLLADPGCHLADPMARNHAGRAALESLLVSVRATALADAAWRLLAGIPPQRDALARYAAGALWLAASLGPHPGVAAYTAPDPSLPRWETACAWVQRLLPRAEKALALTRALQASDCFLLGVGVEGSHAHAVRLKLYWRLRRATPLASFGAALFLDPALIAFLGMALGERPMAPQSLNFSAGFDMDSGELRDIKVDVSWHERTRGEALHLLHTLARQHDLGGTPHDAADRIDALGLDIGCIGLGLDTCGDPRINTYLFQP